MGILLPVCELFKNRFPQPDQIFGVFHVLVFKNALRWGLALNGLVKLVWFEDHGLDFYFDYLSTVVSTSYQLELCGLNLTWMSAT